MNTRMTSICFALASLGPATCLLVGALVGGGWAYVGLFSITLTVAILDMTRLAGSPSTRQDIWLPVAISALHFVLLAACIWAVSGGTNLSTAQALALMLGVGLYVGQVSNACAHELIHRSNRPLRRLGAVIYCSLLNGQHVSAHLLVHHVHAGTARDPNSAPLGRGFWRFFVQVFVGEFTAGLRAENRRSRGAIWRHPYAIYGLINVLTCLAAYGLGGWAGIAVVVALAAHAHLQLMLSDYLQHYGLRRRTDAQGRTEPMGSHHSWNAPPSVSSALMLNAPLHSDHHQNPARTFANLRYDAATMPTLPRSVPVMGAIALLPPLWRRIMDPRVQAVHVARPLYSGKTVPNQAAATGSHPAVLSE
ncbi:alkane 1-monooxygenase [Roseobacter sp.]|uniref:alkane 1-monooxygenase n=1 Tax=Roseobacter sp. TaxID=1907202 RepID=UPI003297CA26